MAGGGRGIGACGIPRGVEKAVVAFVVRTVWARAATFSRANIDA